MDTRTVLSLSKADYINKLDCVEHYFTYYIHISHIYILFSYLLKDVLNFSPCKQIAPSKSSRLQPLASHCILAIGAFISILVLNEELLPVKTGQ